MRRVVLMSTLIAAFGVFTAGPALASQCPKLIAQIQNAANNRLDGTGYEARQKAAEAAKLHGEGKHADSEKVAKEGLALLGVK